MQSTVSTPSVSKPASAKIGEEGRLHPVPARIVAFLAVANAGIDDDRLPAGLDHEAVEREHEALVLFDEGADPVDGADVLGIGLRQDIVADARGSEFHNPGDGDVANLPAQHFVGPTHASLSAP